MTGEGDSTDSRLFFAGMIFDPSDMSRRRMITDGKPGRQARPRPAPQSRRRHAPVRRSPACRCARAATIIAPCTRNNLEQRGPQISVLVSLAAQEKNSPRRSQGSGGQWVEGIGVAAPLDFIFRSGGESIGVVARRQPSPVSRPENAGGSAAGRGNGGGQIENKGPRIRGLTVGTGRRRSSCLPITLN